MVEENNKNPTSTTNKLLERTPDSSYLREWAELLGKERETHKKEHEASIVLFRLGEEWLALSTLVFSEITAVRLIRRIPHRSGDVLRGLVNLRGQLCLCVNLEKLLEINQNEEQCNRSHQRMVAIELNQSRWVFVADEVAGIYSCNLDETKNVPVTVAKSSVNYLKGVLDIDNKKASLIDEDLLFYSLERRIV